MFKLLILMLVLPFTMNAMAEELCDIRTGTTVGVRVVEFASGHKIHSKMSLSESTPGALYEEMVNLQDMGVCEEKIIKRKCILKFEKTQKSHQITLFRGEDKWKSWDLAAKEEAQNYVKGLKRAGFCA